jgi:cation diffusion facilitator family transporter
MNAPANLSRFAWLSIAAALVTFALKLAAWKVTGSVGLLSDALESLVNLAAALISLASLHVASMPADDRHAYGHTKVEYFAGGVEGGLILLAAVGIGWNAVDRFLNPQPLDGLGLGLAISCVATAVNLAVAMVLRRAGTQHGSVALLADAKHLMTDVWTTVCLLLALILIALTKWDRLDSILGMLLAVHIVVTGVKLIHEAMLGLMDTALPEDERKKITEILDRHVSEEVRYHALRTRQAARRRFMSVHILVPGNWSIAQGHTFVEGIEKELKAALPWLTVLTHLEPMEDPASWEDTEI